MTDNTYKTTYTPEEIEQNKQKYLQARSALVSYLREIATLLETAGDSPISGEVRKTIMSKFDMVDRRLLDRLDQSSFAYFESQQAPQSS
jgi:hypothetical protein